MKSNIFKSLSLLILMAMAFVGCSEHDVSFTVETVPFMLLPELHRKSKC